MRLIENCSDKQVAIASIKSIKELHETKKFHEEFLAG
jgi:hypothetical protein